MKYTCEELQKRIDIVHGIDEIRIAPETYTGLKKKAKLIDSKYGIWWTMPYLVLAGHRHPQNTKLALVKSRLISLKDVEQRILAAHGSDYFIVPETYHRVKSKAWFYDTKKKEWFETKVAYVLDGHGNPSSRADRIREKQTLFLRELAKKRIKYITEDGISVAQLCNQYGVAQATYQKLAKSVSVEFAIKSLLSHVHDGKYQKYQSNLEVAFVDLFGQDFPQIEKWNKQPLEADINWHPDFRFEVNGKVLYIDVHGLYFHSEYKVSPKYHQDRFLAFHSVGLQYIQFFADEVFNYPDIVRSVVISKLGLVSNKVMARKTELKPVGFNIAKQFLENNHLMGFKQAKYLGLFTKNCLVSLLGYRDKNNIIEIERFCTLKDSICIGAFGKLVSYLKQFKKPIVSFCDLRYSDGHSYEKLGFKNVGETLGWCWTEGTKRYNRLACKAGNGKTEKENAVFRGWFKIYDAGQRKYRLNP